MKIRVYERDPGGGETELVPPTVLTGSDNPYAYHPAAAFPLCECESPRCPSKIGRPR
ncbi:hypothetical protein [Kitasatospora sp. NPDC059571]|uniref:hypothetical protein n=1 Tax=Kitasatospora sp. NPDC059571 TaxID=3346871 RepID=UPI00367E7DEF